MPVRSGVPNRFRARGSDRAWSAIRATAQTMEKTERTVRMLAGATVGFSCAWLIVFATAGRAGSSAGHWVALACWLGLVLFTVRPLLRRVRGPLPSPSAFARPSFDPTGSPVLAPWQLATAPNVLLGVFAATRWRTAFGQIGIALVVGSFACAALGQMLERSLCKKK